MASCDCDRDLQKVQRGGDASNAATDATEPDYNRSAHISQASSTGPLRIGDPSEEALTCDRTSHNEEGKVASRRLLVSGVTGDAISAEEIRDVEEPSVVDMWASCVTVTDEIGLRLGKTIIMDNGTMNIHAAAIGLVNTSDDQLVFNSVVGAGQLRVPVPILTTSLIFILSVNPIL